MLFVLSCPEAVGASGDASRIDAAEKARLVEALCSIPAALTKAIAREPACAELAAAQLGPRGGKRAR